MSAVVTDPTPLQLLPSAELDEVSSALQAAFHAQEEGTAAQRYVFRLAGQVASEQMARRGVPTDRPQETRLTFDRRALTTLLRQARQETAGAFLAALRGATRTLPLDEEDDRLLVWLSGWDAETVAGVIRLLRLAGAR